MNIDECESQPCQNNGWCEDDIASYNCHCPEVNVGYWPWGGKDCSVKLSGCVRHECQNGATCYPWFDGVEHGHTCLCPHGFMDEQCSTLTTFSFSSPRFIFINVSQEMIQTETQNNEFAIQFRFRTTLFDVLLFYRGGVDIYVLIEIVDGYLHTKAFSDGSEVNLTFPVIVNDGFWRDTHVFEHNKGIHLIMKGPGCYRDNCRAGDESPFQTLETLSHIYVGGASEEMLLNSRSEANFIGCMEDLKIDAQPILLQSFQEKEVQNHGCPKTEWCKPDPCYGNGHCVDLWTNYRCDCQRPFYGERCTEGEQFFYYCFRKTTLYHTNSKNYIQGCTL